MHNFSARSHYPSPSRDAKTRYNASPTSPPLLLVMSHSLVRTEDVPAILDKPQVLHFVDVFVRQGGVDGSSDTIIFTVHMVRKST